MPHDDQPAAGLAVAIGMLARTRWTGPRSRRALERRQQRRLAAIMRAAGASWNDLQVVTKTEMLASFEQWNAHGITLQEALETAMHAERTRDFSPRVRGCTVGLSSGTSGRRGVFLLSDRERMAWAGVVLGALLRPRQLRRIASPWRPPLRIAFLLRSDSNLYQAVSSKRIRFDFHDLLRPFADTLDALEAAPPDLLVGPASVLAALARSAARGRLRVRPDQVISVAEVLEPEDRAVIEAAFGVRCDQVYQATEGLLGLTCRLGTLHLNERHVVIEREWLDDERSRFSPIITDLSRTTQRVWRYRLDDVLRPATEPCPCGDPSLAIEAVEGRADEVLELGGATVFPDVMRRAMAVASSEMADWAITARADGLEIALLDASPIAHEVVLESLDDLWRRIGAARPDVRFVPWTPVEPGAKRVRIRRERAHA